MEFSVGDSVEAVNQLGNLDKSESCQQIGQRKIQADSRESLFHLLTKEKYLTNIKEVALFTIFGSMPACRQTHRNE